MTTTSNSANDCILRKPFVYFHILSRGHSVNVSGSMCDISPLPNSRPFLCPNKIKWQIKGRLRQTMCMCVCVCVCVPTLLYSANNLCCMYILSKGGICDRALRPDVPANCMEDCRTNLCPSSRQNILNNFNLLTGSRFGKCTSIVSIPCHSSIFSLQFCDT